MPPANQKQKGTCVDDLLRHKSETEGCRICKNLEWSDVKSTTCWLWILHHINNEDTCILSYSYVCHKPI